MPVVILFIIAAGTLWSATPEYSRHASLSRESHTESAPVAKSASTVSPEVSGEVCSYLKTDQVSVGETLGFERGQIGAICRPFVKKTRQALDQCGDHGADPYVSPFTWATRSELYRRGQVNVLADASYKGWADALMVKAGEIREQSGELCCGENQVCKEAMASVEVSLCEPQSNPEVPDPCAFGGYFQMSGANYTRIFRAIYRQYSGGDGEGLRQTAVQNLSPSEVTRLQQESGSGVLAPFRLIGGKIVLSSYVSRDSGIKSIEPTLRHEFGHACSMIRMQAAALSGVSSETMGKAARAVQWLDQVKHRCVIDQQLPEAYYDFWKDLGESREMAACLYRLAEANQTQRIDRTCERLCPGHYIEESVGIAFSLLSGDLSGAPGAVFPNTCNHVRDGQHPMVSDVADCLARYSPRFRARLHETYKCSERAF